MRLQDFCTKLMIFTVLIAAPVVAQATTWSCSAVCHESGAYSNSDYNITKEARTKAEAMNLVSAECSSSTGLVADLDSNKFLKTAITCEKVLNTYEPRKSNRTSKQASNHKPVGAGSVDQQGCRMEFELENAGLQSETNRKNLDNNIWGIIYNLDTSVQLQHRAIVHLADFILYSGVTPPLRSRPNAVPVDGIIAKYACEAILEHRDNLNKIHLRMKSANLEISSASAQANAMPYYIEMLDDVKQGCAKLGVTLPDYPY